MKINEITRRGFLKGVGAATASPLMPKIPSLPIDPVNIQKLMFKGPMVFRDVIGKLNLPEKISKEDAMALFKNELTNRLRKNTVSDIIKTRSSDEEIDVAVKKLMSGDPTRPKEAHWMSGKWKRAKLFPWQSHILNSINNTPSSEWRNSRSNVRNLFTGEPFINRASYTSPFPGDEDVRNVRQLVARQNSPYVRVMNYPQPHKWGKKDGSKMSRWDFDRAPAESLLIQSIRFNNKIPSTKDIDELASQDILRKYKKKYTGDLLFKAIKRRYGNNTQIILDNILRSFVTKYGQKANKMIADLFGDEIKQIKDLRTDIEQQPIRQQLPAPTEKTDKDT